jgi:hypothetical protein
MRTRGSLWFVSGRGFSRAERSEEKKGLQLGKKIRKETKPSGLKPESFSVSLWHG